MRCTRAALARASVEIKWESNRPSRRLSACADSISPKSPVGAHDSEPDPQARHNLPVRPNSFVGRQMERARLASLLDSSPLVTLVGPGGVGKTRLALEIAADQLGQWTDGVWLVVT